MIEVNRVRSRHAIFFRQENLVLNPRMVRVNGSDDDIVQTIDYFISA